jgi:hypothetical protein
MRMVDPNSASAMAKEDGFTDGLKRFRLEWEPMQSHRLPARLPKLIAECNSETMRVKYVKTGAGKKVVNWAYVLPDKVTSACRSLLQVSRMTVCVCVCACACACAYACPCPCPCPYELCVSGSCLPSPQPTHPLTHPPTR